MHNPLLMLVVGLLGAALVLIALIMVFTGRSARRRGMAGWLFTPGLLTGGVALIAVAWVLPRLQVAAPEAEFNRLLGQAPAAAGPATPPRFTHIALLVDGTPSDRADASASERQAYSSKLATALGEAVVAAGISSRVDARALPAESWPGTETLRACHGQDLLVTIRLPAVRLPERDDYALWREPSFDLLWCQSGAVQSSQFRVLERPGDGVPYEQAVRSRLLSLLRRSPKA